jgi:hypothetical protein
MLLPKSARRLSRRQSLLLRLLRFLDTTGKRGQPIVWFVLHGTRPDTLFLFYPRYVKMEIFPAEFNQKRTKLWVDPFYFTSQKSATL